MCAFIPLFAPCSLDLLSQFGSLCTGTHKIHYQPQQQWDFTTDADDHPVDLSLVLPHYRARSQPTGHQMSMYVHSSGEIKSTIVSVVNQAEGVTADSYSVPSVVSHTLLPVHRFFGYRTRNALPSIGFLRKNQPLFVVKCLSLGWLQKPYSPTRPVRAAF
jgi:hypothetical protein